MLLIFPPTAKPSEPPAGIARLAGVLKGNNIPCTTLDANIEGLLFLLQLPLNSLDTWSKRAYRSIGKNLNALKTPTLYQSPDRYTRAVVDLNRVLENIKKPGVAISLANYQDQLSPISSSDLFQAAEHYDNNIFYPYFSERLTSLLEKTNPAHIGFSLNYLSQAVTTFSMIGFIKKIAPDLPIILGGGLITSWASNPAWKNPFTALVEHLIPGPGEKPLLNLFGINSLSTAHCPDYGDLALETYLSPGFTLPYAASSGCYWNKCLFCPEKAEANPYRTLPTKQVRADIARLKRIHSPAMLHFLDNAISPALMKSLADEPPNIPWFGFARIDKDLLNLSFCKKLRDSGCVMLKLGIESGDQGVLNAMDKGIEISTISQVLNNLFVAGIATYVYLLFGTPSESLTEARRTMDFVIMHNQTIQFLNLAIFNMPVCSTESVHLETQKFSQADLGLYTDFLHPLKWSRPKIRRFLDQEFKRHAAIRPIILRDPPIFTSNHAPFFVSSLMISQKAARHPRLAL
nr:radical SAM protein [Desulfobulbaceae bacterium]